MIDPVRPTSPRTAAPATPAPSASITGKRSRSASPSLDGIAPAAKKNRPATIQQSIPKPESLRTQAAAESASAAPGQPLLSDETYQEAARHLGIRDSITENVRRTYASLRMNPVDMFDHAAADTSKPENLFSEAGDAVLSAAAHPSLMRNFGEPPWIFTDNFGATNDAAGPMQVISLNAAPKAELITKLDALTASRPEIFRYKFPASIEAWQRRRDPVVMYVHNFAAFQRAGGLEELHAIMADHQRAYNPSRLQKYIDAGKVPPHPDKRLIGTRIGNGIAHLRYPESADIERLIAEADLLHPKFGKIVRSYVAAQGGTGEFSAGDCWALRRTVGEVAYYGRRAAKNIAE